MLFDKSKFALAILIIYAVVVIGTGLLIVWHYSSDGLLFILVIPILLASSIYKRAVYVTMAVLLTVVSVGVVFQISSALSQSLNTIMLTTIIYIILCESFHYLNVSRQHVLASERTQRLLAQTLTEVTLALTSQTSRPAILDEIITQALRLVPFKAADIGLLNDNILRTAASYGYDAFGAEEYMSNLAQPITELPRALDAVRTQQPVVIQDTRVDPRWTNYAPTAWIRSYLAVPICLHKQVLGVLRLVDNELGAFSVEDAERLTGLAHAAAIAIGNVQFYQDLQDHAQHLERRVQERAQEIETNYAQLRAILNSTTDGILVTDLQSTIILMNPVARGWLEDSLALDDQQRVRDTIRDMVSYAHTRPKAVLELDGLDLELQAAPIATPSATATRRPQTPILPADTWLALIATASSEGSAMVVENPIANANR
jgi:GAF domain-containing protein